MRTAASSIMVALVLAALLFGNCLSCPQMLLQDAHRCCHHSKPVTARCDAQGLQHFVKAEASTEASPASATVEIAEPAPDMALAEIFQLPAYPSNAPPDPLSLSSSLRI
jgi:hypothetical protein